MDGFADAGERVFGDEVVAGLAEEQADGGVVIGCLDLGVHGGEVEVELAGVAGFEGVGLEFHDDRAFQPGVIEQEWGREWGRVSHFNISIGR